MNETQEPSDNSSELARLRRVAGQIEGVQRMIEEHRDCPDILMQLRAARAAIRSIESNILMRHLKQCVTNAFRAGDIERKIDEIKALYNRYVK